MSNKLKRQKFLVGQRVHVSKDMPIYMDHFEKDFDGIVDHYNNKEYSIAVIEDEKVVNSISWYEENQLTSVEEVTLENIVKGLQMIEDYNNKEQGSTDE